MSQSADIIRFPAAKSRDIALKSFMVFHALSVASLIFAGWVGFSNSTTEQVLAIAALVSIVLSLSLTFILHVIVLSRRKTSNDPDVLRLTSYGLEGRAFFEKGLDTLPWSRIERVEYDHEAVTVHFQPKDLSSPNSADRISAIRIAKGAEASAEDMATVILAQLKPSLSSGS